MPAAEGPIVDGAPRLNRANGRHQLKHFAPAAEGPVVDGAPRLSGGPGPSVQSAACTGARQTEGVDAMCVRRRGAPLGDAESDEMCTVGVGRFFALVSVGDFAHSAHSIALTLRRCGWEL